MSWWSRNVFSLVHRNFLLFNSCWEDPRIDRQVLQLGPSDTVLVITSAGCNALSYLLDTPKHVYAVDLNPLQNHLLELKRAAIRRLDYSDFFQMFGAGKWSGFAAAYASTLRAELSPAAQSFWDRRAAYFQGSRLFPTFYYRGATGLAATLARRYIKWRGIELSALRRLFAMTNLSDQQAFYKAHIRPNIWTPMLEKAMSWDTTLALFGFHGMQKAQIQRDHGGMAEYISCLLDRVFSHIPLRDNYFWWLYITGSYIPDLCPDYLREANFERLKAGLIDNLSIHSQSIADFLAAHSPAISRFVLLDHMDWLSSHNNAGLKDEWRQILRCAAPDSTVIWRSTAKHGDFVNELELDYQGQPVMVGDLLEYQTILAEQLHRFDRAGIYESFYIANLFSTDL